MQHQWSGSTDEYLRGFETWLLTDLPAHNGAILAAQADTAQLVEQTARFIASVPPIEAMSPGQQKRLMRCLGFAISSCERHEQDRGAPPGAALQQIENAEPLVSALGKALEAPPRDTLNTYALENVGPRRITFTGDPQEHLFLDIVARASHGIATASDLVASVIKHERPWEHPSSTRQLQGAAEALDGVREQYGRYTSEGFSADFFLNTLRQFNCAWRVGGAELTGPSAANLHSQMTLDFYLGTTNEHYAEHVRGRLGNLPRAERAAVESAMATPATLLTKVHECVRTSSTAVSDPFASQESLILTLKGLDGPQLEFVRAASAALWASGVASARHFSVVQKFAIKPVQKQRATQQAASQTMAVDNEKGVSGMDMPEVRELMLMRRQYPLVTALADALKVTTSETPAIPTMRLAREL